MGKRVAAPGFARLLAEWRAYRKMTQHELSKLAGVHPVHLSALETGRRQPSFEIVGRLADALKCATDQLRDALPPTKPDLTSPPTTE